MTYSEYLATMTVKTLREVAARMEIKGQSRTLKADLIKIIDDRIALGHLAAMPEVDTTIQFGKGWDCCAARPARVVVFDNGARWAVCKSCASVYTGEVQELPGAAEESVETLPQTVSVADFLSLRSLALTKGYKLRNKPLAVYKDGFLAMDFTSVEKCRRWLNGCETTITIESLIKDMCTANLALAQQAKALMYTMGTDHPHFEVAVQVHKDALKAYQEARQDASFL